ncbi:MAG TPA: hypothetical protein VGJ22_00850, partial [Anaerolineales bacterium]
MAARSPADGLLRRPEVARTRYKPTPRSRDRDGEIRCDPDNLPEILEHLADVYFYVKDVNSRWRECNSATLTLFNAAKKSEVLG